MGRRRPRNGHEPAAWRAWHVPLSRAEITLAEAYRSLQSVGMSQRDVPLIVQLVENPRFDLPGVRVTDPKSAQCGEVLKGVLKPQQCKLFARECRPERPIGALMVSSEGACAACYNYVHRDEAQVDA